MKLDIAEAVTDLLGGAPSHDYSGPSYISYGVPGGEYAMVTPPAPEALEFADAILKMVAAKIRLMDRDDNYRDKGNEQELFNRSVDALWAIVKS